MNMENRNIRDYLQAGKRAHLVGIGGVSMASLAEVLHGAGVEVIAKRSSISNCLSSIIVEIQKAASKAVFRCGRQDKINLCVRH